MLSAAASLVLYYDEHYCGTTTFSVIVVCRFSNRGEVLVEATLHGGAVLQGSKAFEVFEQAAQDVMREQIDKSRPTRVWISPSGWTGIPDVSRGCG